MQSKFNLKEYNDRLEALFSRFQSVQKIGFKDGAYKPGLQGMKRFDSVLGSPWKQYPCIHVAGTNGKGSVCSMLAAALASGGDATFASQPRRVGLYTSPHLLDFRERMKVTGPSGFEMISREQVWEFLEEYETSFEGLSFFEITTGMAFWWFARQGVGAAVIETGLGGRLDSTNIITPVLSVVTSIGLDHCALLGSTRAEIAAEKAGIFKPGVPAVVGVRDPETAPVFEKAAADAGAPLVFASDEPAFEIEPSLLAEMDLRGPCQDVNLHTVLVALDTLSDLRQNPAGMPQLQAICHAGERTGLWGRWQTVCREPEVICDIGHNPPALKENFRRLKAMQEKGRDLIIVYGIMADKDLDGIAPMMPGNALYILAAPANERSLPAEDLKRRLEALRPDIDSRTASGVAAAAQQALDLAQDLPNPLIYIGGSTFVVAEALPLFNKTAEL